MQLQKDVLIAGGVVVVCVALVVVALVATGKKDAPVDPVAISGPTDSYNTSSYGDPSSFVGPASGSGPTGTAPGGDSYGGFAPAPAPGPTSVAPGYGVSEGPSAFAPSPLAPSSQPPFTPGSSFDPGIGAAPSSTSSFSDPIASAPVAPAAVSTAGTHTVAKGETLGDISAIHYGTTKHWRKIVEANPGLDPARLKIGQVVQIPAVESAPAAAAAASGGADSYTVKKGESYYTIAKKVLGSASRWREIERLNNIPAESLRVGTVIKLPAKEGAAGSAGTASVGGGKTHVVAKGETLGDISKTYFGTTTKWKQIVEANPGVRPENLKVGQSLAIPDLPAATASAGASAPIGGSTYTVKSGDTLETIAAATLGKKSAWKQIVDANPGLQPTSLRIGQVLAIPGGSQGGASETSQSQPIPASNGFAPLPGSTGPAAPAAPAAPPAPTFQDDPFYSPYEALPAPPRTGA
jgi:peptidoglycan endopeptidase LytF